MCDGGTVGVVFDGSFDAFLCVIHDYYHKKIRPNDIVPEAFFQPRLGIQYRTASLDAAHATAAAEGIRKKISEDCFYCLYRAFLNQAEHKYMDLFHYIVAGFRIGPAIDCHTQWDFVRNTHQYAKNTMNEAHFFREFIRFKETAAGVFYSRIDPKNHVLPLIADHFASRLCDERFVIHDPGRRLAVVYDANEWAIFDTPATAADVPDSAKETQFQDLWIAFFNEIAVEGRVSGKRQRNMLPLRYRKNMVEFKK